MTKTFFKTKTQMKLAVLTLIAIVVAQPLVIYPSTGQNKNENYTIIELSELIRQLFAEQLSAGLDVETRTGKSITPVPQALGAPQLKSPTNGATIADTTPTLEWYSVTGAAGYFIEVDDNSAFSSPDNYYTSTTSYTLPTMSEGTYYWRVQASNIGPTVPASVTEESSSEIKEIGTWSETWHFTISFAPLPPPTLISPKHGSVINDNTPTFTWSSVSGATAYQLQVATSLTYSAPYIDQVVTGTSYTPSNSLPDRIFYWRVRTKNAVNEWGSWSSSKSFTIDTTGPDAPTHISPADDSWINTHYPTFEWQGTADSANYELKVWKVDDVSPIIDIQTSNTQYTSSYLSDDKYMWQVRAQDPYGNWGSWSTLTVFNIDTVSPSVPTPQSPTLHSRTSNTKPKFIWSSVSDAVEYELQVSYASDFSIIIIDEIVSTNSYTVTNDLSNGKWYWRVKAKDQAGNWSGWSTVYDFTVDTYGPPSPTLNSPADGEITNDNTPTLDWTAPPVDNPSGYQVQIATDSGFSNIIVDVQVSGTAYTPSALSDGTYYWKVRAKDDLANWGTWSDPWSFTVDTVAPNTPTPVSPSQDDYLNTNSITFSWNGPSDAVQYLIQIWRYGEIRPMQNTTVASESFTFSIWSDDHYMWRVAAIDEAGNIGTFTSYVSFYIDTTAPSAPTPTSPVQNSRTNNDRPKFIWSGISDAVEYQLQVSFTDDFSMIVIDVTVSTTSYTPINSMSDGTYYWRVKAKDQAGNWSGWSIVYHFTIDTIGPPSPTLNSPADGEITNDNTPTLDWTAPPVDNPSGYQVQIATDSGFSNIIVDVQVSGTAYTPSALSDGTYYWKVRAKDDLANWGTWSDPWSFTVDTVAPNTPTPVSPSQDDYLNTNSITFSWNGPSDAVQYLIQIWRYGEIRPMQNTTVASESFTFSIWSDDHYMWRVAAIDEAGNRGSFTTFIDFYLDTTPPGTPTLSSPLDGSRSSNTRPKFIWSEVSDAVEYELQVSYYDDFSVIEINAFVASTSFTSGTILLDHQYFWRVRAKDQAGNWGSWSIVFTFEVDTHGPPAPQLSSPEDSSSINSVSPTLVWVAPTTGDPTGYQVQLSTDSSFSTTIIDVTLSSTQYTVTTILTEDIYYWHVRAKDDLNNWGSWSDTWNFVVDTTAPRTPNLVSPGDETYSNDNTPLFEWTTVTDAAKYQLVVHVFGEVDPLIDIILSATSYTPSMALLDNHYVWKVRAIDDANNFGDWSSTWDIYIDTQPPGTPQLSSPLNGQITSNNKTKFIWSTANGAVEYQLHISNSPLFDIITTNVTLTATSFTPFTPLPDGTWYWCVRAKDQANNWSEWSDVWSLTIDTIGPPAPSLSSPVDGHLTNDTSPLLTWEVSPTATGYFVQIARDSNFQNIIVEQEISSTSFIPSALANDGIYYWRVKAHDSLNNWGLWSDVISFVLDTVAPSSPSDLSPVNETYISDTAILFQWSSIVDASKYRLQIYLSASFSLVVDVTITSTSYSIALDEGVYNWRVTAIDDAGNYASWTAFLTLTVDRTVPSPPELYTPANNERTTNTHPPFSWSIISDAKYYQIQISYADDFSINLVDTTVTSTTFKPSNHLLDGVWYWHVRAVDYAGNVGSWSVTYLLTIDTHGPPAPSLVSPKNGALLNISTLNFDWSDSPEAVGYQIVVSTDSNFASAVINGTTSSSSYSSTLDDGIYYFKVRAYDALNNFGEWSDTYSFTIDTIAPNEPTMTYPYDGTVTNDNTTTITWEVVSDAVEYRLKIFEYGASTPFVDIVIINQTQYTTDELNDGTYEICLSAKDASGNWSNETVIDYTVDTLPPADVILSNPDNDTVITTSSISLSWNRIDDAVRYEIELSIYNDFHIKNTYTTTGTSFYINSLNDNRWYWRVRAVDQGYNFGNWSEVWTFVIDAIPPTVPQPISPSNYDTISNPMPTFSWQSSDTAISYQLQVSKSSGFATSDIIIDVTINDTSYTSNMFISNALYYYRIRACDEWDIWSNWSSVVGFTVKYQPISGPELLDPADNSFLNLYPVTFTWQSVTGAEFYEIQLDVNSDFSHPFLTTFVNDTTYTFTSALPNAAVYWRVRCYDQYNIPGLWSEVYVFTFDNVVPPKPSLISPANNSAINSTSIEFQWSSILDASKYEIIIYNTETDKIVYQTEVTTNSVTVSLSDGYFAWKVRAIDTVGNVSKWSDTWYFEIDVTAPEVIPSNQELTIEYGTAGQTIYWTISDAHLYSYKVYMGQSVIEEGYISESTNITVNISEEWSPALYPFKIEVQDTFDNIATSEINVIIEDTTAPVIETVSYTPTEPYSDDIITIEAHINDLDTVHVYLMYRANGGEYIEIVMRGDSSDFSAQIGPFESETTIDFYIKAVDKSGNNAESSVKTFTVQMHITTSTEATPPVTTTIESSSEEAPFAFLYVMYSFAGISLIFVIYRRKKR